MKATFRRVGNALHPVGRHAHEVLGKLPDGRDVMVEVWRPRNPQHHRKLFAILRAVVANTEQFVNADALLRAIKMMAGYTEPMMQMDGTFIFVPQSIAFESMSQDEFAEFFDRAMDVIEERWPGLLEAILADDEIKKEAA